MPARPQAQPPARRSPSMGSRSVPLFFTCLTSTLLVHPGHALAEERGRRLDAATDAELARTVRLETALRVALERNRELAETRARSEAVEARGQASSRLPDPELKYEQGAV